MSKSVVGEKAIRFAVEALCLYKKSLSKNELTDIGRQFLRSSTSIGANIEEANGAYSRNDFKSKISIAYKEARESQYWLRVLFESKSISENDFDSLMPQVTEICRMLYSILKTMHFGKKSPSKT